MHKINQSNQVTSNRVLNFMGGNDKYFFLSLILIIALKFFLIRNSEVLGSTKDSLSYILMANQKIWGSSLPFMLNQQTRCQDNILLTQKF